MEFEIENLGGVTKHQDRWLPSSFIAAADHAGVRVHLEIEVDDERGPVCRRLALDSPDDETAIVGETLRRVSVAQLVKAAVDAAAETIEERPGEIVIRVGGSHTRSIELPGRGRGTRRRRLSNEELQRVARSYRAAWKRGDPPKRAVADEMSIPESTAGRWVMEARRRGLLGKSLGPGRAGEQEKA